MKDLHEMFGYAWYLQPLRMGNGYLSPHTLIYTAHSPPILVTSYDKSGIPRSYCSNNTNKYKYIGIISKDVNFRKKPSEEPIFFK